MKRYLTIALVSFGFAGGAHAQNPANLLANDVSAILGNLQPATEALAAGLQNTAAQLSSDNPAQNSAMALENTVDDTNFALVDGTTDEFALISGLGLTTNGLYAYAEPLLKAMDNPSAGNIENVRNTMLNPNQVTTIAENLQPAANAVWRGNDPFFGAPNGNGAKMLLLNALQGNLAEDGFLGTDPVLVSNATTTLAQPAAELFTGTHSAFLIGAPALVLRTSPSQTTAIGQAAGQLDGPAEQLAEAANPVADPTGDLIEATEFDAGSLNLPSGDDILAAYGAGL